MSAKKPSIGRVVRAFITALRMTIRGEKIKSSAELAADRYPKLTAWMQETQQLIDQIDAAGGDDLKAISLNVEKREMTVRTILDTIRYHAAQEYPYLLKNVNPYSLMGLQAMNLNDRFLAVQLVNAALLPASVKPLIHKLRDHLDAIPNEDTQNASNG